MANIQTTATADGDDYIINGGKLWHDPDFDWGMLIARTDPDATKHRGLSFIVMERGTPGVTVQPLPDLAGSNGITQTFFDNARVPKANLVGEENRGWYVGMSAMNLERSGVAYPAAARRDVDEMIRYAREHRIGSRRLIDYKIIADKLAQARIEVDLGRTMSYRIAAMMRNGLAPDVEASTTKLYASEMVQRLAQVFMEVLGLAAQLEPGQRQTPLRGQFEKQYLWMVPATISEGTSEMQRNIIATRGLGLPRG